MYVMGWFFDCNDMERFDSLYHNHDVDYFHIWFCVQNGIKKGSESGVVLSAFNLFVLPYHILLLMTDICPLKFTPDTSSHRLWQLINRFRFQRNQEKDGPDVQGGFYRCCERSSGVSRGGASVVSLEKLDTTEKCFCFICVLKVIVICVNTRSILTILAMLYARNFYKSRGYLIAHLFCLAHGPLPN